MPGWTAIPNELLDSIFYLVYQHDKSCFLKASQTCRRWRETASSVLMAAQRKAHTDCTFPVNFTTFRNQQMIDYLRSRGLSASWLHFVTTEVKLPLAHYRLLQPNCHILNSFTCFYLAEYGPNYLFWPDMKNLCSSLNVTNNGEYVMVSFETSARTCSFTKFSTPDEALVYPRDSESQTFRENDAILPWSNEQLLQHRAVLFPDIPTLVNKKYRLCLYKISHYTNKADYCQRQTLIYRNPIQGFMSFNQPVTHAFMSSDNKHLAVAFYGLVHVYRLNYTTMGASPIIFSRQYPSEIKYLGLSAHAEILFIQSMRIGGLLMINLETKEEVDFPHYRLDLTMNLQNDFNLTISGFNETYVYGMPTRIRLDSSPRPVDETPREGEGRSGIFRKGEARDGISKIPERALKRHCGCISGTLPNPVKSIWDYFKRTIEIDYSAWGSQLHRLEGPGTFIGIDVKPEEDDFSGSLTILLYLHRRFLKGLNFDYYIQDFMRGWYDEGNEDDEAEKDEAFDDRDEEEDGEEDEHVTIPLFSLVPSQNDPIFTVCPSGRRVAIASNTQLFILNTSWEASLLLYSYYQRGSGANLPIHTYGPGVGLNTVTPENDYFCFHERIDFLKFLPDLGQQAGNKRYIDEIKFVSDTKLVLYYQDRCFVYDFSNKYLSNPSRDGMANLTQIVYFEDSSHVLNLNYDDLYLSKDNGATWKPVKNFQDKAVSLYADPFKLTRAFTFTSSNHQFVSNDRGESWKKFDWKLPTISKILQPIVNAQNPDLILFPVYTCPDGDCRTQYYYTADGLASAPRLMLDTPEIKKCTFVQATRAFTSGPTTRIMCVEHMIVRGKRNSHVTYSDDWYKTNHRIAGLALRNETRIRIEDITIVQSFAIIQAVNIRLSQEFLFVSTDGREFREIWFHAELKSGMFEFLASTSSSLHVAVHGYDSSLKENTKISATDLYASDSSGLQFTKIQSAVKGEYLGLYQIQKVSKVDGVWISSISKGFNYDTGLPKYRSMITLDDGRTWNYLKVDECGDKPLDECHLSLGITALFDNDKIDATGPTPGIVMGIGHLGEMTAGSYEGSTYVSRDAGVTWKFALKEPCAFNFGDQGNVIVAVPMISHVDGVDYAYYSFDQGDSWEKFALGRKISPTSLLTTPDGSSAKFILTGFTDKTNFRKETIEELVLSLDFSRAFGKCGTNDMELWHTRVDANGAQGCILGHQELFQRRKQHAKCFVNKLYEDVKPIEKKCQCVLEDFECAYGFIKDHRGECAIEPAALKELCKGGDEYVSPKSMRLIPGNLCEGGEDEFVREMRIHCGQVDEIVNGSQIKTHMSVLPDAVAEYRYLDKIEGEKHETVIVRTKKHAIYISQDSGQTFERLEDSEDEEFLAIYTNKDHPRHVYLITGGSHVYVSHRAGRHFRKIKTPGPPNTMGVPVLTFDKNDRDLFIWYTDCESGECVDAHHTRDGGESFALLRAGTRSCSYVGSRLNPRTVREADVIFCEEPTGQYLRIISSTDLFETSTTVFEKAIGMTMTGEFFVVAEVLEEKGVSQLRSHTSVDGVLFARALFPHDFEVASQQAFTYIDSTSRAIFMHVTTSAKAGAEFGTLLKLNSNGTSYVVAARDVNRDALGYVDYERIQSLEGISVLNTVVNPKGITGKDGKKIKTVITYNDGGEWFELVPPPIDSEGKKYACAGSSLEECSLNLHGFTERVDARDTYLSGSAIGILMATGNVGKHLSAKEDASTFLTRDGGVTWREIHKGTYMWEYGDQGTILVLVNDKDLTNELLYSLDEGETFQTFQFSDSKVSVLDIATAPSDTSMNFLLFARSSMESGQKTLTFALDFQLVYGRPCVLDLEHPDRDDFEYWTPKHPFSADKCLFGHEARYLRRATTAHDCYVGSAPVRDAYKVIRNCPCTRADYECDYNYVRDTDGTCKLVAGLAPPDHSETCQVDKNVFEYFEPTGYRRIPLSTCVGGKEFDKAEAKMCPGKEKEFNKHHRPGWFGILLVFVVPVTVFFAAIWIVYDKGIRRNGGFARFGAIRLGEDDDLQLVENNIGDKVINAVVTAGVMLFAGIAYVYKSRGFVDGWVLTQFRSAMDRRSHNRRYVAVPEDSEDEFLAFSDGLSEDDAEELN
ncbi:hypothetical protein BABINDRAFT_8955 [Babjeviella inositovora NRRL Y-12698]|uniref:VPS10 domain-containing protein n=1 Tax=Babjeviella inositovora NRRL Y-12698 TaxID=984486 RepID=A0A1E3QM03_9ASCO|nr:uncharacterized protein BABINDRAFT_8955 [Babjeviella inositovora NRRL Y-12698]ODQ78711.1 hypothetical protein BABINDRAFT_8955 [Babjeviella inositovora NRRL Y-12698]